jgi:hypothetical protein
MDNFDLDDLGKIRQIILNMKYVDTTIYYQNQTFKTSEIFYLFAINDDYEIIDHIISNCNFYHDPYFDFFRFYELYKNNHQKIVFYIIQKIHEKTLELNNPQILQILQILDNSISFVIVNNDIETIRKCIDHNIDIIDDRSFCEVCIHSCINNDFRMFYLFLENLDLKGKNIYETLLFSYSSYENWDGRGSCCYCNEIKTVSLHRCILTDHGSVPEVNCNAYDVLKLLIDNQVGNPVDGLIRAIYHDQEDLVKIFIDLGVEISSINEQINNFLDDSITQPIIITLLIQNGLVLNNEHKIIRQLILETDPNVFDLLQIMINNGTNLNFLTSTDLCKLIHHNHFLMIDFLIKNQVDFTLVNQTVISNEVFNIINKFEKNGVQMDKLICCLICSKPFLVEK